MNKILLSFLFLWLNNVHAQLGNHLFGDNKDDLIYQILQADNGEYFVLGAKTKGVKQIWVMKIKSSYEVVWEKTFVTADAGMGEIGYKLIPGSDNNFFIAGQVDENDCFIGCKAILMKIDSSGNLLWKKKYDEATAIYDVVAKGDKLFAVGFHGDWDGILLNLTEDGNLLSTKILNISSQTFVYKIIPLEDDNFLLVGRANVVGSGYQGIFFRKINAAQETVWTKIQETGVRKTDFEYITDIIEAPMAIVQAGDSTIFIADPTDYPWDIGLYVFDMEGNLSQKHIYGLTKYFEYPTTLTATLDGGWLVGGATRNDSAFALKIGSNGEEQWLKFYGNKNQKEIFLSVVETEQHYLLGGMFQDNVASKSDFDGNIFSIEKDGNAFPYQIRGNLFYDRNSNCEKDAQDTKLKQWFIVASSDSASQVLVTDNAGGFDFRTADDSIIVKVYNPDTSLWIFCEESLKVNVSDTTPVRDISFFAQAKQSCASLEVGLTQPDFRQCDTSCMIATVYNQGTIAAGSSELQIKMDEELSLVNCSVPYEFSNGKIKIVMPSIAEFESARVEFCVVLDCDVQLGATHNVTAYIDPDVCIDPYAGPFFEVEGSCEGDNVSFSMRNSGTGGSEARTTYSVYINELLVADHIEIQLPEGGEDKNIHFQADGRTWRVELDQSQDVPFADYPSASVEGCGVKSTGLFDIGLRNGFRPNDFSKKKSVVLAPNTLGTVNEVAEAFPGLGSYNLIMDDGVQEYTARVENDMDMVVSEVVFDLTFTKAFNIETFRIVSSNSTPEVFILENDRIRIRMDNMNLSKDEVAMIRFSIEPIAGLQPDMSSIFFKIQVKAYLDGYGPILLSDGFQNFVQIDQHDYEKYSGYPDYMQTYGGRNADFGTAFTVNENNDLFLTGFSNSFVPGGQSAGYVIQTDPEGKVNWYTPIQQTIPGTTNLYGIQSDGAGGCIYAGNFKKASDPGYSYFDYGVIGRLGPDGKQIWSRIVRPVGDQIGTTIHGILKTSDGYVAYGNFISDDNYRLYFKFDIDGNILWEKHDYGHTIDPSDGIELEDGSMIFTGGDIHESLNKFPVIQKITADGNLVWESRISTFINGIFIVYPSGIVTTEDSGILIGGSADWSHGQDDVRTPLFVKCDSLGKKVWVKAPL
ncbi:MAG: hypothetical protein ABI729_07360, partial [Chitinophagales bacterium]